MGEDEKPLVVSAILLALREQKYNFRLDMLKGDSLESNTDGAILYQYLEMKSEHLFLAIFLQQYNNDLNNYIHDFNKIPSLVGIDTYNKSKLVELIDFFDSFPLLFNGERIKPA